MPLPGSLYQLLPPTMMIRPSARVDMSAQNMSPLFSTPVSGVQVGLCSTPVLVPVALPPTALPIRPSPGRPGTPATPSGSVTPQLSPERVLGFLAPPPSSVGTPQAGPPLPR